MWFQHKLYLQKLKATFTFKAAYYIDIKQSFIKDLVLETEDIWKVLLQEPLFLNDVLPEMDSQSLLLAADYVLNVYLANDDLLMNESLINCDVLTKSVLYCIIRKISKHFKQKQKSKENDKNIVCKQLFSVIDADLFVSGEELNQVYNVFIKHFQSNNQQTASILDLEKLILCINIIKKLPVLHMPKPIRDVLLLFLIAVLHDSKNESQNEILHENLEHVIVGKMT